MVTVQFGPQSFHFTEKGGEFHDALDLTVAAVNVNSKISGNDSHLALDFKPQTRRMVDAVGFRVISQIDLPPGRYQLRVAARSVNASTAGSVHYDLDVPDFSDGPLSISGLVLGSAAVRVVPTGGTFVPLQGVIAAPPTTFRDFLADGHARPWSRMCTTTRRKRNEGGVASEFARRRCGVGVGEGDGEAWFGRRGRA